MIIIRGRELVGMAGQHEEIFCIFLSEVFGVLCTGVVEVLFLSVLIFLSSFPPLF